MSVKLSQVNIFRVDSVPAEMVQESAKYLINAYGEQTSDIRAVFQAGTSCADFTGAMHFPESTMDTNDLIFTEKTENLEEYYGRLVHAMFVQMDGTPVPPCSTINLFDKPNERLLFLAVAYPGLNVVYYEKTVNSNNVGYAIDMVSGIEGSKLANRMEPDWRQGNTHDLVMMAQMFGFPYDKVCDEVIIPPGRPQSSFMIGKTSGLQTLKIIHEMAGGH
ncbi:hypothetical protein AVU38_gp203 [Ralstonia phage RSL2]|uniref:Uncharacterized protein n=1 Tax=Ralstonia phage RSL2 TaxID=1585840 RepID=A0A0A8JBF8_9CAUD|nr:hypothetical protein AVU38_gp203 [Ralstonia phage RSL2]BAQ02731.1 hypothetical protein [Ralstonia phage RSL2]